MARITSGNGLKAAKFRNVPTTVDGIRFASKLEARHWSELRMLEKTGAIRGLERQKRFSLTAGNGVKIGTYVADFFFEEAQPLTDLTGKRRPFLWWQPVAQESKGHMTPLAKWKLAHFCAEYKAITLRVVRR